MYQVIISSPARKFIKKLPSLTVKRIIDSLDKLAVNPRPHGSKKLINSDVYRIRVGNYRIIYSINDTVKIVDVRKVGHRKDVYE